MTTQSYPTINTHRCFYSSCIPDDLIHQILDHLAQEDQETARALLSNIMDSTALRSALAQLETTQDKVVFLELCRDEFTSSAPLDWLTLRLESSTLTIRQSLERALLALIQKIETHD